MDILRDIIKSTCPRHIPDDVELVEGDNGVIYLIGKGPFHRRFYDPISGIAALAGGAGKLLPMAGKLAGPLMSMMGTREEGKAEEEISKAREALLIKNKELARRYSIVKAEILGEERTKLGAKQLSQAAAANIRINVGAPLVIAAKTRADITKDIGYILETGREQSRYYQTLANIERYTRKMGKRSSKWDLIGQGLGLFKSIAGMGFGGGMSNATTRSVASSWLSSGVGIGGGGDVFGGM